MSLNFRTARVPFGYLFYCFIWIIWGSCADPAYAVSPRVSAQNALAGKTVLVLHAFESNVPIFELTDRGLRETLDAGGVDIRNQFFEYLDLARNPGPEHRRQMAELLRLRYGQRKIDIIITLFQETLAFLLKEGRAIFPDAPVFALYLPLGYAQPETTRPIIRQFVTPGIKETLEIALKLTPETREIFVVSGANPMDRSLENLARKDSQAWEGRLGFHYLSDRPLEEILKTISGAPARSVVLLTAFTEDVTGESYTTLEVARRLSRVSKAPVFGLFDILIGQGVVGGSLISFKYIGSQVGDLALEILRGTQNPKDLPTALYVPPVPMFDWAELKRWNLHTRALPAESIVVNKQLTLWNFRYYIAAALAFILAQTLLIGGLLMQKRRRRSAEEALLQKTEELSQFFNVTLELLCIANTDGYFLLLNPAWENILGYSREELMAQQFVDFVHKDDLSATIEVVSKLALQREIIHFENRYRCKDGRYRWLQWTAAPAGNRIFAAARDITERKQMEEMIQKAAEEWQTTFDSIPDIILILDRDLKILRHNAAAVSFFERPSREILGRYCHQLLHAAKDPPIDCPAKTSLSIRAHQENELFDEKRNAWFLISTDPIIDKQGQVTQIVHRIKDITSQKTSEVERSEIRKELWRSERQLRMGELAASLAHELNQPLTSILSNANAALRFIETGRIDMEEFKEILEDIASDDKRAGNIIHSLRSMFKQEEGQWEPVAIGPVLLEVVSLFKSEAVIRKIKVDTDFADLLPPVIINRIQIQQVVLNLLMNAAESIPDESPERRITLRTHRSDRGDVQVSVCDTGSGIAEKDLARIFDPFFTIKPSGIGMGLSISRTIIEAHGGRIWAANNPDKGATFTFDLPVAEAK